MFDREECCSRPASQHVGRLRDCFPILTPNDSVFKRKCIPFLRSSAVLGKPGSAGKRFNLTKTGRHIYLIFTFTLYCILMISNILINFSWGSQKLGSKFNFNFIGFSLLNCLAFLAFGMADSISNYRREVNWTDPFDLWRLGNSLVN